MKNINCVLEEKANPIQKKNWKKYCIDAFFKVDGETIEKNWIVSAASVFAADRWANLMIENESGTLKNAKKQIIKL